MIYKIVTCLIMTLKIGMLTLLSSRFGYSQSQAIDADIAILNGTVIDGSGTPGFKANVAIRHGKIVYLGNGVNINAAKLIEAQGLVVSPGFIDGHSHVDYKIKEARYRLNESALTQGITTIIFGADGEYSPTTIEGLLATFSKQGVGTNVGFYVGHNGIREEVMQDHQLAKPSTEELAAMVALVKKGMQLGAVGFSTGLMYEPGRYSDTDEVVALTKAIVEFGGIYDSHVRDPINGLIESDREVIIIAKRAKVAAKIAHLKAVCLQNKDKSTEVINMVNQARLSGLNIVSDQYPYDGAKTFYLASLINLSEQQRQQEVNIKSALRDPVFKEQLQKQSEWGLNGRFSWLQTVGYSCIRITQSDDFPELVGLYLSEIAASKKIPDFELLTQLLLSADKPIQVTLGGIQEKEVQQVLVQPWNMIVSDGRYIHVNSSLGSHPRSTGTFPRILGHYVRDLQLLTLEQAIQKMTSQPADFLGLVRRGRLKVGNYADITIFNPLEIKDKSSYSDPLAYSVGVQYVLVNGQLAILNGNITGSANGTIVRRIEPTSPNLTPVHAPN